MTLVRILSLTSLLACSLPALAAHPAKKVVAVAPDHLLQEAEAAYRAYRFEAAQGALAKYKTAIQRRREALPERAQILQDQLARAVRMYSTAEALHVVDSSLVAKRDWIKMLPQGSGKILAETRQLAGDSLMSAASFQDALGKTYLRSAGQGLQWLSALGAAGSGRWEESTTNLTALSVDSTFTSPFLLENGSTLIYARQTDRGLGGYDLYMSRLDGNDFYLPSLLGMPYNSPANDYLLAYHESEGWGVLVSDRFAPADSLHIYRFTGRPAFVSPRAIDPEPEEVSEEERYRRATLQGVLYADSLSLHPAKEETASRPVKTQAELHFVLQGDHIYQRWADFATTEGLNAFRQAEDYRHSLEAKLSELQPLRERWTATPAEARASLRAEILLLEASVRKLQADQKQALRQARYYEGVR